MTVPGILLPNLSLHQQSDSPIRAAHCIEAYTPSSQLGMDSLPIIKLVWRMCSQADKGVLVVGLVLSMLGLVIFGVVCPSVTSGGMVGKLEKKVTVWKYQKHCIYLLFNVLFSSDTTGWAYNQYL